jgi:hypothetical protein
MKHQLIKNRVAELESLEAPDGISQEEIKYALAIIQGYSSLDAYKLSNPTRHYMTHKKEVQNAYKYKRNPIVQKYIKALNKELERVAVANALDIQMFLSAAIFTPIVDIDENHPLCQKTRTVTTYNKDGDPIERVERECVSKIEALKALIRLKGMDAPIKVDINHNVGVMVVPMASNVDDWEQVAAKTQQRLMDDAIDV